MASVFCAVHTKPKRRLAQREVARARVQNLHFPLLSSHLHNSCASAKTALPFRHPLLKTSEVGGPPPASFFGYSAASARSGAKSQVASASAATAPSSCAATKGGTLAGAIPAKLLERLRATVIAGLAKLVDEVNQ